MIFDTLEQATAHADLLEKQHSNEWVLLVTMADGKELVKRFKSYVGVSDFISHGGLFRRDTTKYRVYVNTAQQQAEQYVYWVGDFFEHEGTYYRKDHINTFKCWEDK